MYLRTDEESEAAEAICMSSKLVEGLEYNTLLWRWVIIALHNAVQGFMVLSLRHGNGLDALTKKSASAWLKAYREGKPSPKERLDSFLNLYKKVESKKYCDSSGNNRFVPKGTQGRNIKRINSIRNEFIHFTPKGWSLEIDGLPQICLDNTALIEFLGWQSENIFWHEESLKEKSQLCTYAFNKKMKYLAELYESFRS